MSNAVERTSANHVNRDFKEWKKQKAALEDSLIANLKSSVQSGSVQQFENYITGGANELAKLYCELPPSLSANDDSQFHRNKKLRTFFGEMCKTDVASDFIVKFLEIIPVSNEAIQQMSNQYPLHLAISSGAFSNVETLLKIPGINVNVLWKKQTPLMLLLKATNTENFTRVETLVNLLANKQADINIGDYTKHPLSVVCHLTAINEEQKRRLLTLCIALFKCDVDSFYEGQTRRDITALIPDFPFEPKRAEVTLEMMKSLLLAENEADFINELDGFIQRRTDASSELTELLMSAACKGRSRCVEAIFTKTANSDALIQRSDKLSKVLKIVCAKGYSEVLELFLNYVTQPAVFNEKPLALACVQRLYRDRTANLEECLEMLLSDPRVSMETSDHTGRTALDFARQHNMNEEVFRIIDNEVRSRIGE